MSFLPKKYACFSILRMLNVQEYIEIQGNRYLPNLMLLCFYVFFILKFGFLPQKIFKCLYFIGSNVSEYEKYNEIHMYSKFHTSTIDTKIYPKKKFHPKIVNF